MGQHDGTINFNVNEERIAEPNDINGILLEISFFTKMDMKSTGYNQFFFSFFHKVYREFLQAVRTANIIELA